MGDFDNNDDDLYFSHNSTIVFWNLEDYPITVPADYDSISRNITTALHQMGFWNLAYIVAFGDKLRQDTSALKKTRIIHVPEAPEDAAFEMAQEMVLVTSSYLGDPVNVVVIAKPSPESVSRNNPVLLVQPPDNTAAQDSVFHSVEVLVDCTQLLGGEKPISKRPQGSAHYHVYDDAFRWRKASYFTENDSCSSDLCERLS